MLGVWSEVWKLLRPARSILVLGLLLIIVNRLAGLVLPASTKYLIDDVIAANNLDLLPSLVLAVLGATFLQGAAGYGLTHLPSKSALHLIAELQRRVQRHIGRLPLTYYNINGAGALISRILGDVEIIENLVGASAVQLVSAVISAVVAFAILAYISPILTAVTFVVVVVFITVLYLGLAKLRSIFLERRKLRAQVAGRLWETLVGVRVVKSYCAEEREAGVFSYGVRLLLKNALRTLSCNAVLALASSMLLAIIGALVMYFGARQIAAGVLTLGDLTMFVAVIAFLVGPLGQVVRTGTLAAEALAGLDRTIEVLQEDSEDVDPRRRNHLGTIRGEVRFEDVSFAYKKGEFVLHGISLCAMPNTVTALVGPSGSGKSTVAGLVAAFYTPQRGRIFVDNIDLSTVRLSEYRSQLGIVFQEDFLFDGTIAENIRFGRPDATDKEFLAACRLARVDEFAGGLGEKYDTVVGERGVMLSGGQRQRISIARAILADPRILILDEATSSLDAESERMIQHGLAYLMTSRTTFVIAHRLSTVREADQILVVENGRITECGTHKFLHEKRGRYYALYREQLRIDQNHPLSPARG